MLYPLSYGRNSNGVPSVTCLWSVPARRVPFWPSRDRYVVSPWETGRTIRLFAATGLARVNVVRVSGMARSQEIHVPT